MVTPSHHIDHHIDTIVGKGTEEDISGHLPLDLMEQPTSIVRVALFKLRVPITVAAVEASSSMGPRCDIAGDKLRLRRCRAVLIQLHTHFIAQKFFVKFEVQFTP